MRWLFLLFPLCMFAGWAEKTLSKMSLEEKIGQLFVAPACPLRDADHREDWTRLIKEYHIGNAIVKHSDPERQIHFLNSLQKISSIPLLICADAEWGLAMRMSNTIAYPRNMTLGAIGNLDLIYQTGKEIGRQARAVGIHMNLAPVADVNNNPANPVIHMRSFGEDPERVADCVSAFARGLQAAGILACAKHFPGHGDTKIDSHVDLPRIEHPLTRLESVEWVPFQRLIDEGIAALMTAHLLMPALDDQWPTSLSAVCLELARNQLHFKGLILTDALNMKAIANRYSPEVIAVRARKAGSDLLLYGDHINPNVDEILRETIPRAFNELKEAYQKGELDQRELDRTVLKILQVKEQLGLNQSRLVSGNDWGTILHHLNALALKKQLFQEAVTLIGEPQFPIHATYLSFGEGDVLSSAFPSSPDGETVVIAIHQKEALTPEVIQQIEELGDRAIVCLFTSPYVLSQFKHPKTILMGYENDPEAQWAVLRVLTGEAPAKGHLPIAYIGRG